MKFIKIIFMIIVLFVLSNIAFASDINEVHAFTDNSTSFEYNEWVAGKESAWDVSGGFIDQYVWSPIKDIFTVDDDTLQQQIDNGNGNLTSQIGMQQSLFEQKKENILELVNKEWDYVIILLMIIMELLKSFFYIFILYGMLWIIFVAMPMVFMKIKESFEIWLKMRYNVR